jgi:phosphoribosyl 1,2-cyclic phosphate phosphodiesterase
MAEPVPSITLTVLGSGTSVGVPTIGCDCKTCTSPDWRDRRLRPSVLLRYHGKNIVIDTGPDFRYQALRAQIDKIDAVLYTHAHADHILGIDDLRPFNFRQKGPIPIFTTQATLDTIKQVFAYIFYEGEVESSRPKIELHLFDRDPFELHGITVQPIPIRHGSGPCHGFRFGKLAYLTDHSEIPEDAFPLLEGVEVLFLDALRYKPHPTHSTVDQSLKAVARLNPRLTYFTHISHDLLHERAESLLPPHVRLAYDGLEVTV